MKTDYYDLAVGYARALAAELKGPLPDFYEFCAQKRVEEEKALEARLATPEARRDELLKYVKLLLRAYRYVPKCGDLAGTYGDLESVVREVELRR
ncbi:MAG TPA: hypothetical protein VJ180_04280 [Pyrinomonadaceae bacterium]|nr:hypothetical protein [Pyrinomonadaceae bacterium]